MSVAAARQEKEELRLALVMNGGVSLAIWIAGVSHEINRFVAETHPVYASLLELTFTQARVDVISGTSAGGINGAALALTCVYDTTLHPLRDLWLAKGAFGELLRSPSVPNPPSILDGNGYFLGALSQAFTGLVGAVPRPADVVPIDLSMTATMLRGELHSRLDDFGERVEDVHHRALFHVSRDHEDPFAKPKDITQKLANAARASASFPIAFEPRLYQPEQVINAVTGKDIKQARYLIDGGVLDNKPLRSALRAVFRMRTTGSARRILAYIVPDPTASAAKEADTEASFPTIAEVAMASLLGIPSSQSIADQLREIDEHNAAVRAKRRSLAWLAARFDPKSLASMAETLFVAYQERRVDGLLDYVLDQVNTGLLESDSRPEKTGLGNRTRDWLKTSWKSSAEAAKPWQGSIPAVLSGCDLEPSAPAPWSWGFFTLQFVMGVALDLLRRTQRLSHLILDATEVVAPNLPQAAADVAEWETRDQQIRLARNNQGPQVSMPSGALAKLWIELNEVLTDPAYSRERMSTRIRSTAQEPLDLLAASDRLRGPAVAAQKQANEKALTTWLDACIRVTPEVQTGWSRLAKALARILLELRQPIIEVLNSNRRLRADEAEAQKELRGLYGLLMDGTSTGTDVMARLLHLAVLEYSIVGGSERPDVAVEFVQISARSQSPWGGGEMPGDKLTGMQLGHFGAFYRKSWRANDWMIGRLDAIDRIVRIALNPDRLHRLYAGRQISANGAQFRAVDYVYDFLRALAVDSALASHQSVLSRDWREREIREELAFLESTDARAPDNLPRCAAALTRRLQLEVLCIELPVVAKAVIDDDAAGASPGQYGNGLVGRIRTHPLQGLVATIQALASSLRQRSLDEFRRSMSYRPASVLAPDEALAAFRDFPIGRELVAQESGSDLMTRTSSRAIAVVHSALVGRHSGLPGVRGVFRVLTLPVKFLHLLASMLVSDSATSAAIGSAVLVGGLMLLVGVVSITDPPELLAPAGWSLVLGWFAAALLRRTKRWVPLVIALVLSVSFCAFAPQGTGVGLAAGAAVTCVVLWGPAWLVAAIAAFGTLWWTTGHVGLDALRGAACAGPLAFTRCNQSGTSIAAEQFFRAATALVVVFGLGATARFAGHRGSPR